MGVNEKLAGLGGRGSRWLCFVLSVENSTEQPLD